MTSILTNPNAAVVAVLLVALAWVVLGTLRAMGEDHEDARLERALAGSGADGVSAYAAPIRHDPLPVPIPGRNGLSIYDDLVSQLRCNPLGDGT